MYNTETPDTIKARILNEITLLNTQQGSFADDMAGPMAYELFRLYGELNRVSTVVWPDETGGEYLDLHAKAVGLTRKLGAKAEVILQIAAEPGYVVPDGTAFLTETNLYFYTRETVTVPEEGEVKVLATAKEVGTEYNVSENSIVIRFTDDTRIEKVTNPQAAAGGVAIESDRDFYNRIDRARKRPGTSGNRHHYEEWALEVPGVGNALCIPLWAGRGTVKVIIADEHHNPVDDAVLLRCTDHIEEQRPIGPTVTVVTTTPVKINVSATLELQSQVSVEIVKKKYEELLTAQLAEISLEHGRVIYNWLAGGIMSLEGVVDYTDLLVNGEKEDIVLVQGEVPTLGEVVFQ